MHLFKYRNGEFMWITSQILATAFHRNKISIIVSMNNSVKKGKLAIYHTTYLNVEFVKECGLND